MIRWLLRRFADDTIREECERRGIDRYQDPVDELEAVPDDRGTVYCWRVDNPEAQRSWIDTLGEYQDRHGEFDALHIVVTDDTELNRLSKRELEPYLS